MERELIFQTRVRFWPREGTQLLKGSRLPDLK